MDALGRKHVGANGFDHRHQRCGASPDPVRQRRHIEFDAFPRIALALPVERLVLAELGIRIIANRLAPARARAIT